MKAVSNGLCSRMCSRLFLPACLCVAVLWCVACSGVLSFRGGPCCAEFVPQTPEVWQLDNGLTVMFLEDRELPLVSAAFLLKGGSLWESADLPGAAGALGSEMRDGGAGEYSAEALDERLRDLSADISSSFDQEYGMVGFSGLSSHFPEIFALAADVLLRPRFENSRLELWKVRAIDGIRRRVEDPEAVAGIAFRQLIYGKTPYGRITDEADIKKITRQELLRLYGEFVIPNGAILAVSGDISGLELRNLVCKHLETWRRSPKEVGDFPPLDFQPSPGIYFIKLPFEQATVNMGMQGVPRLTPDMSAIDLFNEVFGSGRFGSRLFKKVRAELGLSYSVSGGIYAGPVRGTNSISLQTKGPASGRAIAESLAVLQGLQVKPLPGDELDDMKGVLANSFVFRFDSRFEVVRRQAFLKLLQYPPDYYETYLSRSAAVSAEQIRAVAAERWDLEKFVVVVVGDENAYTSLRAVLPIFPENVRHSGIRLARFDQRLILE